MYRIDVQAEINVQVEKFLKNIKRAGQNRRAGGKIFSKSINVQTKIRPCRGEVWGGNFLPLELWDTLRCFGILKDTLEYFRILWDCFGIALGLLWDCFGNVLEYFVLDHE